MIDTMMCDTGGDHPRHFCLYMHRVQSCKMQMHSLCDILSKNSEKSL